MDGFLRPCKENEIWIFMPSAKNMAQKMYQDKSCAIFTGKSTVVHAINGRAALMALHLSIDRFGHYILTDFCDFSTGASKSAVFAPI